MRKNLKNLTKSEFTQNVLKLSTSTVLAGAIRALGLAFIAHLFTPGDLGNFQACLSIITVIGMVASLKYDMAIVLPKEDDDANHLALMSAVFVCVSSVVAFLILSVFEDNIQTLLDIEGNNEQTIFISLGICLLGLLQIARSTMIRKKEFGLLASNKVLQMALSQGSTLGFGMANFGFPGLFWGYALGIVGAFIQVASKKLVHIQKVSMQRVRQLAREYKKFPLFQTSVTFLNQTSLELPVFMLSAIYDSQVLGIYAIANQTTVLPINLVGSSVSQVYFKAAADAYNRNPRDLMAVYRSTVRKLAIIGIVPLLGILLLAEYAVELFYGSDWLAAGQYMQIIIWGIYARFISSPIGTTFSILNRQEVAAVVIFFSLIIRFTAMYIFSSSIEMMLWALSISTALFYLSFNFVAYLVIRRSISMAEDSQDTTF